MTELTAERLRELLDYAPEAGIFIWRVSRGKAVAGAKAGTRSSNGYLHIGVDGRAYRAHRLAWLYVTGSWPIDQIDHINLIRTDNHWANLREATRSQNYANRRPYVTNKSGHKGVSWFKRDGRWRAAIVVNRKCTHLGLFDTREEAHAAYVAAAKFYFGEFARSA